ncbi:MAG: hypothetical protein K2M91_10535 [Lachnospiraceae bacterium]|nr:hypothetical protein [Lachnospiraceae bacterium]
MGQEKKQNTANLEKLKEIFLQPKQEPGSIKVPLEPFDSPNWGIYEGAGGDIVNWLQKLLDGEKLLDGGVDTFDECCQYISHQMSFYSAIYLVFPYLVEALAEDFDKYNAETLIMYISELGICLMTDCDMVRQDECKITDKAVLENYQLSVEKFQLIIKHFLARKIKSLSRVDRMTKSMFALAVLAAVGNREEAFLFLNAEMDEYIYIGCDACEFWDEDNLDLTDKKALSVIRQREQAEDNWDGENFQDTNLWFGDFLELIQVKGLAKHLPYYLGTFRCPECGKEATIVEFMKNHYLLA